MSLNNIATVEEQKAEVINRLKLLKVHNNVICEFEEENLINYSDRAILCWVKDNEILDAVAEFEKKYDCIVYHIIKSNTEFGIWWSCLYVSKHKDEWKDDKKDLINGYAYAYVYNGYDNEIGMIGVKSMYGGVLRTA